MTNSHEPTRRRFLQGAGLATGGVVGHAFAAGGGEASAQAPAGASPGARFRALLERPEPSRCINCGDVATARLAEMHGLEMVMTGGSALSLSKYGFGDFGMITMDDLVEFCNRTADAVDVPIIADAGRRRRQPPERPPHRPAHGEGRRRLHHDRGPVWRETPRRL